MRGDGFEESHERRLAEQAEQEATLGELRRLLRGTPVRLVALYLAERLGCDKSGRFTIELRVEEGGLRRASILRGPFGGDEFERFDELEQLDAAT